MSHHKKAPIAIITLVLLLAAGGVFAYLTWNKQRAEQPPAATQTETCRTVEEKTECAQDYIGLTEEEGMERAKTAGFSYRTVERDGKSQPRTMDFSETRLNFSVTDNRITKVEFY